MIHKKTLHWHWISLLLLLSATVLQAQIGTPTNPSYGNVQSTASSDYYSSLIGLSGTDLRNALQNLMVNSTTKGQTYGDAWLMLEAADENPTDNTQVWQVYTESGIAKTAHVSGSTGWNREHVFPQSRGGFSSGTSTSSDGKDVYFSTSASQIAHAHADAHHLRASDAGENARRADLDFSNVSGARTLNSSYYEPPLSAKGDIARSLFYIAVRYDDLSLAMGDQNGQIIGDLTALLDWHSLDPVDDYEIRRNNVIFDWQNNRNPFTDNPNLAAYIWGDKQGVAWPGNTDTGIRLTSIAVFPVVPYGAVSAVQSYQIEGTELGTKLNIDAPAHFEISLTTTDADFVKYLELNITDGQLAATTIYVRFEPEEAVGGVLTGFIDHYSDNKIARLELTGTEGDPASISSVIYTQNFETDCAPDWVIYSVSSNKNWACNTYGHNGGAAMEMNNYEADAASEDWLVSPLLNTTGYANTKLEYWMEWDYSGSTVELFYSTDYSGTGNPNDATWTKLADAPTQDAWTLYSDDLQSFAASSFYIAFKHIASVDASSRINLDDISLTGTELVPQITTTVSSLNFDYTAANTAGQILNYTIEAENLEADLSLTTLAPFELSTDQTTWNTTLTVVQASADNQTVYVRYMPAQEYIGGIKNTITHSSSNATNLLVNLLVAANPNAQMDATSLTKDKTLDMVTWNLEWFGTPAKSGHASTWAEQLTGVSTTMLALDADIYALQEVVVDDVNGDFLTPLVNELNAQAGAGTYAGIAGARYSLDDRTASTEWPAQRVCYIYRTANFANVQSESMFTALYPNSSVSSIDGYTGIASLFWASGRLPFLLEADVTVDGTTVPFSFINIHAKCCSDSKDRKIADALFLKAELDQNYSTKNVVVLGDYNDYEEGSMSGGNSPYITWYSNSSEDYLHAYGAQIDHISISDELYFEYQSLTNNGSVTDNEVSDHDPVLLRLKLDANDFVGQIITVDPVAGLTYNTDPIVLHAQSSLGLPVAYVLTAGNAVLVGNVLTIKEAGDISVRAYNLGNTTTAAANASITFTVYKASQSIIFDLATEINLSEGSVALRGISSQGLSVSYRITAGQGSISDATLSFTEAGDITVEAYNDGDANHVAASESQTITVVDNTTSIADITERKIMLYPNPTNGMVYVQDAGQANVQVLSLFGTVLSEQQVDNNATNIDLSHLAAGMYVIRIISTDYKQQLLLIKR